MNHKFLKRLNLQSLARFILCGDEIEPVKEPLPERIKSYEKNYISALDELGNKLPESEFEELAREIMINIEYSEDAYFELGLKAAFQLAKELNEK